MTNEEMMAKAGKIREQAYETLQEEEKRKVDDIAPSPFQKQWNSQLKEKITTQLHDDYVKTDLMTKEAFDKELGKWIEEI
jgi:predicted transcriptional regulator